MGTEQEAARWYAMELRIIRSHIKEKRMKKVVIFVAALLLTVHFGTSAGIAEEKDINANSAESDSQGKIAPASKQEVKKIGLDEARKIVAARVNGTDIMLDAVMQLADRLNLQMTHAHSSEGPSIQTIQREALDRIILWELAYQKAKARGLVVEQKAVDAALTDIKTKAGSEERYKKILEQGAMTEEQLRAQVEKNLILETIYKQEVLDTIRVPEEKLTEEYEKNKGIFTQPEKISVVDVAISLSPSDKGAETRAEEVLKKIRENGNDPEKLVQDGTFVVRDYDPKKDSDKELYEAARKLNPGELSGVIKTSDNLHIIKLVEYTPEKLHAFAEVKSVIERKLRADAQNQKTREWFDGLKKDAKIEILVHEQRSEEQTPK
jgi:parvulin-like peptidyl-prolyl isomerase